MALRLGLVPLGGLPEAPALRLRLAGLELPNPVGLAAGIDKNAAALAPLARAGFGFLEVGAATPRPQPGNPTPRLFRLQRDAAVINRFGFNNQGAEVIAARLAARRRGQVPVGLNLGANKDSEDRAGDFARVLTLCGPHADFVTVNISSPNTERLRALQGPAALAALLARVIEARADLHPTLPVFLKIAPDLNPDEIAAIAETAMTAGIDAIIATNTTLAREGLKSADREQVGGLSGAPLFEKSTRVLAQLSRATDGKLPLIGVGGIGSPEQAIEKLRAGASAVQLYSALAYQGLGRITASLAAHLATQGLEDVSALTGTGRGAWL